LAEAIDRIAARLRRGERVDIERELAQNPDCADGLRLLLPTLEALVVVRSNEGSGGPAGAPVQGSGEGSGTQRAPGVQGSEESNGASIQNPKSKIQNQLGDFELLREVGRGGMGIVYEARQVSLARRVAVKVLPAASLLDARQLQRFQNEARAAAQLSHPHIVDVISFGCDAGVHYFAMRFVEGRTLAEVIADEGSGFRVQGSGSENAEGPSAAPTAAPFCRERPPWRSVVRRWMTRPFTAERHGGRSLQIENPKSKIQNRQSAEWIAQAAEALEHAHASGVVHRDVKPSNLLVDGDGKLWVTDFGVARFGDDAGLTFTGDLLGTLRYMSPEQALGRLASIGPRSDVYSLGATLYELLASRPVFDGEDRGELLRQVAFERPPALRTLDPRLPRDLATIAHKALEKSPDDRYATAGEMAADLRRFLRGEPVRAKPPTLAQRATKWCLRHRRLVAGAAMLLLLVVAGLAASTLLIARSRDEAVAAQKIAEERDRENRRMLSVIETGLAMQAYQQGDLNRAKELLDRQVEDGLPSPSRQTGDGLGRPSSQEEREQSAFAPIENPKSKIQNPQDDFRGFAWHWLRQAIDARCPELKSFDNQAGEVYEVDYSPDGTLLAAACDRRIIIHDAHTGEIRHDIDAHESGVTSLDFSPDGALLASVSYDDRVRLWHVATGKLAADLGAHDCDAASVAFSPDGRRLATGDDRGLVIIWDVVNRREQKRLERHGGKIDSLAFAPDGRLVVISGDWYLTTWDVDAPQALWRVKAPHTSFIPLAISPDMKTAATGDHGGIVGLWSMTDGAPLGSMGLRLRVLQGLAFSPDSRLLASGGQDNTAQLWDVGRQIFLGQTPPHRDRVWSVAFSPDGEVLATGSRDGTVKLWDVYAGRTPRRLATAEPVVQLAFSPSGHELAVASGADIWRWPRGAARAKPRASQRWPASPVIAWRGESLVIRDEQGSLWLDQDDGTSNPWIRPHGALAHQLVVSPDGHWLAVRDGAGGIEIWDAARAELRAKLGGSNATPCFSADGQSLIAGRERRLLRWNMPRLDAAEDFFQLSQDVYYVAYSPDGQTLALGYDDARLELADVATGRRTPLVGHSLGVTCAAFSPDGGTLASGSFDGTLRLWSVATGQEYYTLERRPNGDFRTVVFSSDGRSLAASGRDGAGGRVSLWEVK